MVTPMPDSQSKDASGLSRREVVAALLKDQHETLVVTGLGSPTYDVHAAGDRDDNYYLWGAMGGAALVGLGLAQAQPSKRVLVITGDGELLMALGGLATIGVAKPGNLDIVVLDNESYGETGMQASHTGHGVDLAKVAEACGFVESATLRSMADVERLSSSFREPRKGPRLFAIKVKTENLSRSMPTRDAVYIKNRFRAHLGSSPN
jgi:thiamine pyrophosphate-dependent acetolactate synthase large subunit-like protein